MDKLVNTVINERKAKGLTQVQLAEATGINRAMIGRLENSDYIPSIDQLQRLGENLGFEVTDLFVGEEETPKDMVLDTPFPSETEGASENLPPRKESGIRYGSNHSEFSSAPLLPSAFLHKVSLPVSILLMSR